MTTTLHVVQPGETPVDDRTMHLSTVTEMLDDIVPTVLALDGQPFESSREGRAEANRTLLHLADQFDLAAALVRNTYWHGRERASYDL